MYDHNLSAKNKLLNILVSDYIDTKVKWWYMTLLPDIMNCLMQIFTVMQWHWLKGTSYMEWNAYHLFDRAASMTSSHIQLLADGEDTYSCNSCGANSRLKIKSILDILTYETALKCDVKLVLLVSIMHMTYSTKKYIILKRRDTLFNNLAIAFYEFLSNVCSMITNLQPKWFLS